MVVVTSAAASEGASPGLRHTPIASSTKASVSEHWNGGGDCGMLGCGDGSTDEEGPLLDDIAGAVS